MFEKLGRWFRSRRNPERMREDEEARLRAKQELRQAEQARSDDRRALEGAQKDLPFGGP
jgi:hypothetical protein